ncbi:MAG: porin [Rickettsiales bacterium]
MKKIILTVAGIMLATFAFAEEAPKVTLGGSLDTQIGYLEQQSLFRYLNFQASPGNLLNSGAIVNNTRIYIDAQGKASQGFTYGARLELYSDASPNADNRTTSQIGDKIYGFLESKYGRVEIGAVKSSANQMRIDVSSIARAAGGSDGDLTNWLSINNGIDNGQVSLYTRFQETPGTTTYADSITTINRVNYFTPKWSGVQLALSYAPDVEMIGTVQQTHLVLKNSGANVRNSLETTLLYEGKTSELTYSLALTGEVGKAKPGAVARNDIKAYMLGGQVGYKNLTFVASFGDWLKSATPKIQRPGAKFGSQNWSFGAAYADDKFGASIGYFESRKGNSYVVSQAPSDITLQDLTRNKFRVTSIGLDYQLTPGLMPYAEIDFFTFKRSGQPVNNQGTLFLAGSKLKF